MKTEWIGQKNIKYRYFNKLFSISCFNLRSMAKDWGGLLAECGIINGNSLLWTVHSGKAEPLPLS